MMSLTVAEPPKGSVTEYGSFAAAQIQPVVS